jgi:hypothetical protein
MVGQIIDYFGECYYLLRCDTMQCDTNLPKFQRNVLPPSSGLRVRQARTSKQASKEQAACRALCYKTVNFYKTKWCHIPEDSTLHSYHCQNLNIHTFIPTLLSSLYMLATVKNS